MKNFRRLDCTDFKKLLIGLDQLYEKLETTSIGSDKKLAIGNIVHNQKAGQKIVNLDNTSSKNDVKKKDTKI